jgi:hypothetical protein
MNVLVVIEMVLGRETMVAISDFSISIGVRAYAL